MSYAIRFMVSLIMTVSSVALRLEKKRLEKGISHRALGLKSGVNHAYLKNLLEGKSQEPRRSKVEALAKALECPVEYFYENDVSEHESTPHQIQPPILQKSKACAPTVAIPMYTIAATPQGTTALKAENGTAWHIPIQDLAPFISDTKEIAGVILYGDSMEPVFRSGERILFDFSLNKITTDGVYLITTPTGVAIKQLQIIPDEAHNTTIIRVSNKNPGYASYDLSIDQITVHGRAIAKWMWL